MVPIESSAADQICDDADMAAPEAVRVVDRHPDLDVKPATPTFELAPEQDVRRTAGAVEHDDATVVVALGDEPADRRSQRREPEPAGNDNDVAAFDFPRSAKRCRKGRAPRAHRPASAALLPPIPAQRRGPYE